MPPSAEAVSDDEEWSNPKPYCQCPWAMKLLSNNKSTNDYNYSTLQQAVLCAMVATTYLATQLNWGKTK